jgi:hypothetical protein
VVVLTSPGTWATRLLLIGHDWVAIQKNNRRSFDSLRYAPVAQDDSYLVMQSFGAGSIADTKRLFENTLYEFFSNLSVACEALDCKFQFSP